MLVSTSSLLLPGSSPHETSGFLIRSGGVEHRSLGDLTVLDTVTGDARNAAPPSPSRRRSWFALGSVALSAALVVVCIICVDAREVGDHLVGVEPRWLLAFFLIYVLQVALLGLRWSSISRQLGVPLRWRRASSEYALSVLLNNVLPTGFAGDGLRAVRHSQRSPGHGFAQILEALALDRVSGQLALLLIVIASIPITLEAGLLRPSSVLLAAAGLGGLLWALYAWTRRSSGSTRLVAPLHAFLRRANSVMLTPARAAVHLPISLLLTATLVLQLWLAARAAGIVLDFGHLCWLGPLIVLAASAPSFFGSWGVREGASALLFSSAGLPSSAGVSLSLLFGCFSLISALPGVVVLWFDGPLAALERGGAPGVEVPDAAAD